MTVAPNLYVGVSLQQLIQLHVGGGHATLGSSRDDLLHVNKIVEVQNLVKDFRKSAVSVLEGKIYGISFWNFAAEVC